MIYYFCLGREQKIALLELKSVLRRFCFDFEEINPDQSIGADFEELNLSLDGNCAVINIKGRDDSEVAGLIENLGGTLKIYKIVASGDNKLSNQIASLIVDKLNEKKEYHTHRSISQKGHRRHETEEVKNPGTERRGKINFGVSNYSNEKIGSGLGASIKTHLKYRRVNSRYLRPKEGELLSSAESWHGIFKKQGIEIGFFEDTRNKRQDTNKSEIRSTKFETISNDQKSKQNNIAIGVLIAVSNPDEWARKDFGKPRSDAKSGMMPPKLARMLINIACGQAITKIQDTSNKQISNPNNQIQNNQCESVDKIRGSFLPIILDPFCGSGNILLEALDMGFSVAGGDISERAVSDTRANLEWFLNQNIEPNRHKSGPQINTNNQNPKKLTANSYQLKAIELLDATKSDFQELLSVDGKRSLVSDQRSTVIVTEPYLGAPRKEKMSEEEAKGEIEKLKPLYINFLNNIYRQKDTISLKSICVVFPLFELSNGKNISLFAESIDEIEDLGYIVPCAPLKYGREYQRVKREIVILATKSPTELRI